MAAGLQILPSAVRAVRWLSCKTAGVCIPVTVCPPGQGHLQPGCFQIHTLVQAEMQRSLVNLEKRPRMNCKERSCWPAIKCGNSMEETGTRKDNTLSSGNQVASCLTDQAPLFDASHSQARLNSLSFPAGQHFSSYNSATSTLQTDLYLQAIPTSSSPGQNPDCCGGDREPSCADQRQDRAPSLPPAGQTVTISGHLGSSKVAAAAEEALFPGWVLQQLPGESCHPFPEQLLPATSSRCEPACSS